MANKIAVGAIVFLIIIIIIGVVYLVKTYIPNILTKFTKRIEEQQKSIDELSLLYKGKIEELTLACKNRDDELSLVCKSRNEGLAIKMNESKKEVDETLQSILTALKKVDLD